MNARGDAIGDRDPIQIPRIDIHGIPRVLDPIYQLYTISDSISIYKAKNFDTTRIVSLMNTVKLQGERDIFTCYQLSSLNFFADHLHYRVKPRIPGPLRQRNALACDDQLSTFRPHSLSVTWVHSGLAGKFCWGGGMSESEQDVATALLLRFYMNKSGATYAEIAEAAGVPTVMLISRKKDGEKDQREDRGKNVLNFHNTFSSEHADKIRPFLEQKISDHIAFRNRPRIIDNLIDAMRGTPIRPVDGVGGLLSAYIEDGDRWKQRVADVYGGAWYIVRFAAHLGPHASEEASKSRDDPWMVYAIMDIRPKIEKYGNDLPGFFVRYRPLREREPRNIFGNVLSLKTGPYMIFMGLEEGTTHPVVIAADQNRDGSARPKIFRSLILRKAEHGSFISGYTMFIRAHRSWSDIESHATLGKVGVRSKSQLIELLKPEEPTIDEMIPTLRNVSKNRGNAMLCL